jgi:hypothetical protein
MNTNTRPSYVGTGECRCGRIDVQLYRVADGERRSACARCLADQGVLVARARTADDVEEVDGNLRWKEEPSTALVHVGKLDLGYGHYFEAALDVRGDLAGWLHAHPDARDATRPCKSFCAVRAVDGLPVHVVAQADPLTLSPSLKCRSCGAHGEVINGKWEPR